MNANRNMRKVVLWSFFNLAIASSLYAQSMPEEQQLYDLARDAYLFAYPLVSMDITMQQATNVPDAQTVNMRAPVNQFAHARQYPNADEKDVVRFNFDTLYSFAWLDLDDEALVLSVPDTNGRYYLLPMIDMWTDVFAVVGSRTTGTAAGNYLIVGPQWHGDTPKGMTKIVAPTPIVWIIGRTQTNGPSDYARVHEIQDGYHLTPLSRWGVSDTQAKAYKVDPAIDDVTPPFTQVNRLDGVQMLSRLAELLTKHPPHANDYPILFRLRRLGIEPGKPFDGKRLSPDVKATINRAAEDALASIPPAMRNAGEFVNGWNIGVENMGTYGTSYKRRALVAYGGLGCNLPEDAVYPTAYVDVEGQPLSGQHQYLLHFDRGQTPPAEAFWSITMYDNEGFQVPNPIDRFAVSSHNELKYNDDGSLDIYVQAESPGTDKESNWLPAPKGPFEPTMRLYSPRQQVLDLIWSPPPFVKVN